MPVVEKFESLYSYTVNSMTVAVLSFMCTCNVFVYILYYHYCLLLYLLLWVSLFLSAAE